MLTANRSLTVLGILGIGAGTGAAVGAVVDGEKGAIIGALVGAGGSSLYTYLLAGGLMLTMDKQFFILHHHRRSALSGRRITGDGFLQRPLERSFGGGYHN